MGYITPGIGYGPLREASSQDLFSGFNWHNLRVEVSSCASGGITAAILLNALVSRNPEGKHVRTHLSSNRYLRKASNRGLEERRRGLKRALRHREITQTRTASSFARRPAAGQSAPSRQQAAPALVASRMFGVRAPLLLL